MANINFIDTYIGYPGHPMFRNSELIEDDVARVKEKASNIPSTD